MINRYKYRKINDKKLLHKKGKRWITISVALLGAIGGSMAIGHNVHADPLTNIKTSTTLNSVAHPTQQQSQSLQGRAQNNTSTSYSHIALQSGTSSSSSKSLFMAKNSSVSIGTAPKMENNGTKDSNASKGASNTLNSIEKRAKLLHKHVINSQMEPHVRRQLGLTNNELQPGHYYTKNLFTQSDISYSDDPGWSYNAAGFNTPNGSIVYNYGDKGKPMLSTNDVYLDNKNQWWAKFNVFSDAGQATLNSDQSRSGSDDGNWFRLKQGMHPDIINNDSLPHGYYHIPIYNSSSISSDTAYHMVWTSPGNGYAKNVIYNNPVPLSQVQYRKTLIGLNWTGDFYYGGSNDEWAKGIDPGTGKSYYQLLKPNSIFYLSNGAGKLFLTKRGNGEFLTINSSNIPGPQENLSDELISDILPSGTTASSDQYRETTSPTFGAKSTSFLSIFCGSNPFSMKIPYSAIYIDPSGTTWIYINSSSSSTNNPTTYSYSPGWLAINNGVQLKSYQPTYFNAAVQKYFTGIIPTKKSIPINMLSSTPQENPSDWTPANPVAKAETNKINTIHYVLSGSNIPSNYQGQSGILNSILLKGRPGQVIPGNSYTNVPANYHIVSIPSLTYDGNEHDVQIAPNMENLNITYVDQNGNHYAGAINGDYDQKVNNVTSEYGLPNGYHLNGGQDASYVFNGNTNQSKSLSISGNQQNSNITVTVKKYDGSTPEGTYTINVPESGLTGNSWQINPNQYAPAGYQAQQGVYHGSFIPNGVNQNNITFTYGAKAGSAITVNYVNQNGTRIGGGSIPGNVDDTGSIMNRIAVPAGYTVNGGQNTNYHVTLNPQAPVTVHLTGLDSSQIPGNGTFNMTIQKSVSGHVISSTTQQVHVSGRVGDNYTITPSNYTPTGYTSTSNPVQGGINANGISANSATFVYRANAGASINVTYREPNGRTVTNGQIKGLVDSTGNVYGSVPMPGYYHFVSANVSGNGGYINYHVSVNPQNIVITVAPDQITDTVNFDYNGQQIASHQHTGNNINAQGASDRTFNDGYEVPAGWHATSGTGFNYDGGTHIVSLQPNIVTETIRYQDVGDNSQGHNFIGNQGSHTFVFNDNRATQAGNNSLTLNANDKPAGLNNDFHVSNHQVFSRNGGNYTDTVQVARDTVNDNLDYVQAPADGNSNEDANAHVLGSTPERLYADTNYNLGDVENTISVPSNNEIATPNDLTTAFHTQLLGSMPEAINLPVFNLNSLENTIANSTAAQYSSLTNARNTNVNSIDARFSSQQAAQASAENSEANSAQNTTNSLINSLRANGSMSAAIQGNGSASTAINGDTSQIQQLLNDMRNHPNNASSDAAEILKIESAANSTITSAANSASVSTDISVVDSAANSANTSESNAMTSTSTSISNSAVAQSTADSIARASASASASSSAASAVSSAASAIGSTQTSILSSVISDDADRINNLAGGATSASNQNSSVINDDPDAKNLINQLMSQLQQDRMKAHQASMANNGSGANQDAADASNVASEIESAVASAQASNALSQANSSNADSAINNDASNTASQASGANSMANNNQSAINNDPSAKQIISSATDEINADKAAEQSALANRDTSAANSIAAQASAEASMINSAAVSASTVASNIAKDINNTSADASGANSNAQQNQSAISNDPAASNAINSADSALNNLKNAEQRAQANGDNTGADSYANLASQEASLINSLANSAANVASEADRDSANTQNDTSTADNDANQHQAAININPEASGIINNANSALASTKAAEQRAKANGNASQADSYANDASNEANTIKSAVRSAVDTASGTARDEGEATNAISGADSMANYDKSAISTTPQASNVISSADNALASIEAKIASARANGDTSTADSYTNNASAEASLINSAAVSASVATSQEDHDSSNVANDVSGANSMVNYDKSAINTDPQASGIIASASNTLSSIQGAEDSAKAKGDTSAADSLANDATAETSMLDSAATSAENAASEADRDKATTNNAVANANQLVNQDRSAVNTDPQASADINADNSALSSLESAEASAKAAGNTSAVDSLNNEASNRASAITSAALSAENALSAEVNDGSQVSELTSGAESTAKQNQSAIATDPEARNTVNSASADLSHDQSAELSAKAAGNTTAANSYAMDALEKASMMDSATVSAENALSAEANDGSQVSELTSGAENMAKQDQSAIATDPEAQNAVNSASADLNHDQSAELSAKATGNTMAANSYAMDALEKASMMNSAAVSAENALSAEANDGSQVSELTSGAENMAKQDQSAIATDPEAQNAVNSASADLNHDQSAELSAKAAGNTTAANSYAMDALEKASMMDSAAVSAVSAENQENRDINNVANDSATANDAINHNAKVINNDPKDKSLINNDMNSLNADQSAELSAKAKGNTSAADSYANDASNKASEIESAATDAKTAGAEEARDSTEVSNYANNASQMAQQNVAALNMDPLAKQNVSQDMQSLNSLENNEKSAMANGNTSAADSYANDASAITSNADSATNSAAEALNQEARDAMTTSNAVSGANGMINKDKSLINTNSTASAMIDTASNALTSIESGEESANRAGNTNAADSFADAASTEASIINSAATSAEIAQNTAGNDNTVGNNASSNVSDDATYDYAALSADPAANGIVGTAKDLINKYQGMIHAAEAAGDTSAANAYANAASQEAELANSATYSAMTSSTGSTVASTASQSAVSLSSANSYLSGSTDYAKQSINAQMTQNSYNDINYAYDNAQSLSSGIQNVNNNLNYNTDSLATNLSDNTNSLATNLSDSTNSLANGIGRNTVLIADDVTSLSSVDSSALDKSSHLLFGVIHNTSNQLGDRIDSNTNHLDSRINNANRKLHADYNALDDSIITKASRSQVMKDENRLNHDEAIVGTKADRQQVLNAESTINKALNTKANQSDVAKALSTKADRQVVEQALATKADRTAVAKALSGKADKQELLTATRAINKALDDKADKSAVDKALSTKADRTAVAKALSGKADKQELLTATRAITRALGNKADKSAVDKALSTKADKVAVAKGMNNIYHNINHTSGYLQHLIKLSNHTLGNRISTENNQLKYDYKDLMTVISSKADKGEVLRAEQRLNNDEAVLGNKADNSQLAKVENTLNHALNIGHDITNISHNVHKVERDIANNSTAKTDDVRNLQDDIYDLLHHGKHDSYTYNGNKYDKIWYAHSSRNSKYDEHIMHDSTRDILNKLTHSHAYWQGYYDAMSGVTPKNSAKSPDYQIGKLVYQLYHQNNSQVRQLTIKKLDSALVQFRHKDMSTKFMKASINDHKSSNELKQNNGKKLPQTGESPSDAEEAGAILAITGATTLAGADLIRRKKHNE